MDERHGDRERAGGEALVDRAAAPKAGAAPGAGAASGERVGGPLRRARAHLGAGRGRGGAAGRHLSTDPDRRAADAVGLLLRTRHGLLQLAPGAGAPRGARLRGRARALPPARPRPLAPLLGARRTTPARLARAARLAPRARPRASRVQSGGVGPYPFERAARCRRREALSRVASAPARAARDSTLELVDVPPSRPLELRNPRKPGVDSAHGDVSLVRRGEPGPVSPLRVLRHPARARRAAAGGPEDGHDRLLRPEGVDEPRRGARLGVAARGHEPVL